MTLLSASTCLTLVSIEIAVPMQAKAFAEESMIEAAIPVGFNVCPRGFATVDGRLQPISGNSEFYSIFEWISGGDGFRNFALPDLAGCVMVSGGSSTLPAISYPMGKKYEAEFAEISEPALPSYIHSGFVFVSNSGADTSTITNGVLGAANIYAPLAADSETLGAGSINVTSIEPGLSNFKQGTKGGSEYNSLTVNGMPSHGHSGTLVGLSNSADLVTPVGAYLGHSSIFASLRYANKKLSQTSTNVQPAGRGTRVSDIYLLDPMLAIRCCLALDGVYPS